MNKVSDPMAVHCASRDTDYGNCTIAVDQDPSTGNNSAQMFSKNRCKFVISDEVQTTQALLFIIHLWRKTTALVDCVYWIFYAT